MREGGKVGGVAVGGWSEREGKEGEWVDDWWRRVGRGEEERRERRDGVKGIELICGLYGRYDCNGRYSYYSPRHSQTSEDSRYIRS